MRDLVGAQSLPQVDLADCDGDIEVLANPKMFFFSERHNWTDSTARVPAESIGALIRVKDFALPTFLTL